ncbi:Ig-like V-type domain-containing protein FAM187A [Salminus brasiliensis]|uniref:Ig-like V-type domain-containing protein FAM187A n=1 Tax=Salminus brasiliensis TaxID=930266 RepID=UPI003B83A33F
MGRTSAFQADCCSFSLSDMRVYRVFLLSVWTLCPSFLVAYQAPEDKEDIFTTRACPALLVFDSVAYLADMTIELPCHCKPEEALSVVWYYQKYLGTQDTRVLTDFSGTAIVDSSKVGRDVELRSRFSIRLFSLIVFRVQEDDSGHYVCGTASGEFFYGYDVDVQVVRRVLFPSDLVRTNRRRASEAEQNLYKPFQMFMSYWPWSKCDRCGVNGEQTQVGLCYVMSQHLQVRYLRKSSNVTSCGSSAVPPRFGLANGDLGAELAVRSCHNPCSSKSTNVSPERKDLLDFLGYGDPKSPGLAVYYHNHPVDSDLVLSCPGTNPQHAVAWDKGSAPLYRTEFMEGLNRSSRVFIDVGHHLHFRPVRLEDKGSYFCWIQGEKAAEIKLGVYSRPGRMRRISDPESVFVLEAILMVYALLTAVFLLILSVRFIWQVNKERRALY